MNWGETEALVQSLRQKLETAQTVADMQAESIRRWEADCTRMHGVILTLVGYLDSIFTGGNAGEWVGDLRDLGASDTVAIVEGIR